MNKIFTPKNALTVLGFLILASGCGSNSDSAASGSTEDSSTSGTVASAVGGASNGSSGGTMAYSPDTKKSDVQKMMAVLEILYPMQSAEASSACPTIASGGSACAASGSTATLTYASCSFGSSPAVWNGSQTVVFSGATPTCGSAFPTGMSSVVRTFGAGTTRTSGSGISVAVDTAGAYTAVDGNTYSGGATVSFASGERTALAINGLNIWAPLFHHSLATSSSVGGSTIAFTNGNTINSGTVVTFHNLARVKGSSTFNDVVLSAGCCTPTSGTISTSFSAISGVTPTALGSRLVGTTETLTFTGCGTAVYAGIDGTSGNVTLAHCF